MNIALALKYLYLGADQMKEFEVRDNGHGEQYIAIWNLDKPKPTEEELQAAWVAYQEAGANKPPLMTALEKIQAENAALKKLIEEKDHENKNALFEIYNMLGESSTS
ncbi:XkdW family protein [Paenibacillus sp. FSL H7-0350]|uniref:XkdW family protein n=1 Tax=Paenibacillus sp. FSL H7-0350 TaxID=2975345 RepID=UPI0031596209